jgi:hypothetical protein
MVKAIITSIQGAADSNVLRKKALELDLERVQSSGHLALSHILGHQQRLQKLLSQIQQVENYVYEFDSILGASPSEEPGHAIDYEHEEKTCRNRLNMDIFELNTPVPYFESFRYQSVDVESDRDERMRVFTKKRQDFIHPDYTHQVVVSAVDYGTKRFQAHLQHWIKSYPYALDRTRDECNGLLINCNLVAVDDALCSDSYWINGADGSFYRNQSNIVNLQTFPAFHTVSQETNEVYGDLLELRVACQISNIGGCPAIVVIHIDSHYYYN